MKKNKPVFKIDGKKIGIGDTVMVDGKELELVDYLTDGERHEFCLGDRETREAKWGYFLINKKVTLAEYY